MRLLIAVLLSACLFAQPKQPKSTSSTDSKQDYSDAQDGQKAPSGLQPLTPKSSDITESHISKTDEDAEANRKIAAYTQALANYTLALVVVGSLQFAALVVQGIFLWRAFRQTREATGLTRNSLAEVLRANQANEALVEASNKITRDATDLTKQSLVLTHRPKLIALNFSLDGEGAAFAENSLAEGKFRIVNDGGTRAYVDEIYATATIKTLLPTKPFYFGIAGQSIGHWLSPGEALIVPFRKDDGAIKAGEIPALIRPSGDTRRFYVLGFIKYTDEANPPITRKTFFCRKFNRESWRFEPLNDPDYEHAD